MVRRFFGVAIGNQCIGVVAKEVRVGGSEFRKVPFPPWDVRREKLGQPCWSDVARVAVTREKLRSILQ